MLLLYENIDLILVNSLQGKLDFEIGGLECRVITTEYTSRVRCHMLNLFCNASVHRIYSVASGQYSYTIVTIIIIIIIMILTNERTH